MSQVAMIVGVGGGARGVGFKDIDEQLRYLRQVVSEWRIIVRNLAIKIIQEAGVHPKDKRAQALAIASWVQKRTYYVHELPERFQTPAETLRLGAGDCDDTTVLVGSLLESVGIPAKLICMSLDGSWAHIFPAAALPGGLLPLDTTLNNDVYDVTNPTAVAEERGQRVTLKMV